MRIRFVFAHLQLTCFSGHGFFSLLSLDLSSNALTLLDDSLLLPRSLKYLNLACNYLTSVQVARLSSLETLILSYNSIHTFPVLPEKLINLDISHNPPLSDVSPILHAESLRHLIVDDRFAPKVRNNLQRLISLNENSLFIGNVKIYSHPVPEPLPLRNIKKTVLSENNQQKKHTTANNIDRSSEYAQYKLVLIP